MRKNILMVIDSLGIGGAEKITLTLAELFVKEGFNVDIICIYDHVKFPIPEGVQVHSIYFTKKILQNYIYRRKLQNKIDNLEKSYKQSFSLILVHLLKAARLMQNYQHKKLYYVLHSTMSQESLSGLVGVKRKKRLARLSGKFKGRNIIAVSQGIAEDFKNIIGIKYKSLQVIYNPINLQNIEDQAKECNLFEKDKPYIMHLGRLVKVKRHDRLLKAYKDSNIDAKLLLVGEGPLRSEIEKDILRLGLQEKVILTGLQMNPYPIIRDARLLALSSDYEGLNMALLEALALNIPVVSVDCPSGPREILEGYLEHSLVAFGDKSTFAKMIASQYKSPQKISSTVLKRFSGNTVIKQYISLIYKSKDCFAGEVTI